jgi:hypothetical protein
MRSLYLIFLVALAPALFAQPAQVSRVLKTLDFEERRLGNAEDLPMHFSKVEGAGLPHYVNGRLATDVARSGKFSFRFDLNGGSLVYRYDPGRIRVQVGAHYRVEAWARTTVLEHARARLSAYFATADGLPVRGTRRHSELLASKVGDSEWRRLSVELSADHADAASLVLELELLQPQFYAPTKLGKRTLFMQDIRGSAWFDDVTVSQVPRVTISTDRPGNVFRRGEPLRLSILVSDRFTDDLAAQLRVHDAAGEKVYQRTGALNIGAAESPGPGQKRVAVVLPELPAGWYAAELVMTSRGQFVGEQRLELIQLADSAPLAPPDDRFGVIGTELPFEGWSELPDVLPLLSTGRVKLAVWSAAGDVEQMDPAAFDQMLVKLQERQIVPTACLVDLPPGIKEKLTERRRPSDAAQPLGTSAKGAASADSIWPDLLKADKADWQPQLAQLIARHANHLDRWQLGADGSDDFVTIPAMREVYGMVYREFAALLHEPDLAMPWPAWYELDGQLPATVALSVPPSVLPHQLPLYIADVREKGRGTKREGRGTRDEGQGGAATNLSLSLQLLDARQYGREVQIRDLAQRITYALAAEARRIDLPLPYAVEKVGDSVVKRPGEMMLILRTLITALSGSTFKGKVPIAEGVEAFLFERHGQGILVLWDRGTTSGVKQLAVNLGERAAQMDLWGNVTPLLGTQGAGLSGTMQLAVGPMPTLLVDIDASAAMLRASVAIDRPLIESSFQAHSRRLRFVNPYKLAISGSVKLKAPAGWTINPSTHSFSLNPGESFDRELTIEFPYNSYAGAKTIEAQFTVQADRSTAFSVPLTLQLGLSDVGMQTLAIRDGADVVVIQTIQNYGDRPIDYSGFAIYPGAARQERLITNLGAGRTTIKRYRFTDVKVAPPETKIRVGVKELNGTRILNEEVEIQ